MLILTRRVGEALMVGDETKIVVLRCERKPNKTWNQCAKRYSSSQGRNI